MTNTNQVTLTGRVSAAPDVRVLPSGDTLVSFRLVVRRPPDPVRATRQTVDTIECVVWRSDLRAEVEALAGGEHATVTGALRRRFRRGAGGPQSFVSVEVDTFLVLDAASVASEA